MYHDGIGVPQDYAQSVLWLRKPANQGDADAQNLLGIAYSNGLGVPLDFAQAAVWFRKSADQGNPEAQFGLGCLYHNGQGVPQDEAEAYFWLDLAASGKLKGSDKDNAVKYREDSASNLTKTVLLETQERARKWSEAHPSNSEPQ
jgi:TPR repeat protein